MKKIIWGVFLCFFIFSVGNGKGIKEESLLPIGKSTRVVEIIKPEDIVLEKDFLYDQHTLQDTYSYNNTTREFQWEKIKRYLALVESAQQESAQWAYIENRRNEHGQAPLVEDPTDNNREDQHGVDRYQGIPLYEVDDLNTPERYGIDGAWVKILNQGDSTGMVKVNVIAFTGEWLVPRKYIESIDTKQFNKVVMVDRKNQNIATLEHVGDKWLIRSMNPATTGLEKPPYQKETPLGIFVVQEKKEKMYYYKDGTQEISGFAPYASRFSNGGYVHGVPVNYPKKNLIEFSNTLGTTPRSHMCVRNATSHAEFVYNWAPVNESLVIVIE